MGSEQRSTKKDGEKAVKPAFAAVLGPVRTAAVILLVFVGVLFSWRESGAVTALPVLVLLSAISAVVSFIPFKAAAAAALSALCVGISGSEGGTYSAIFALACAAAALITFYAVKLVRIAFSSKKRLLLIPGILLVCIPLAFQFYWYGAPWDAFARQSRVESYLETRYPDQKFDSVRTWLDRLRGGDAAVAGFSSGKSEYRVYITEKDGVISDGYFDLFIARGSESRQSELVRVMREAFPDEPLSMSCTGVDTGSIDAAAFPGKFGSAPDWLKERAALEIGMKFAVPDPAAFAEAAGERFAYLKGSGIRFGSVTLLGGEMGVYNYKVTLYPEDDPSVIPLRTVRCSISMEIPSVVIK